MQNVGGMLVRCCCVLTLATQFVACQRPIAAVQKVIALQPYGEVASATVETVRKALEAQFGAKIVVLDEASLPSEAYYEPRKRYRAEILLRKLESWMPDGAAKIIGVTEVDVSTTKGEHQDWGVFGLALLNRRACVVSTFRLSDKRLKERIAKVAVHEIGHTLGLPHCQTKECVMQDAKGSVASVDKNSIELCDRCRSKIR